jgi:hypothetical protein
VIGLSSLSAYYYLFNKNAYNVLAHKVMIPFSFLFPSIVYDLPAPVEPYAKIVTLIPRKNYSMKGATLSLYIYSKLTS